MTQTTTPAAARIPASRIPLFMVQIALHHASAAAQARAALRAALALVPLDDWPLRDAIRSAAAIAAWANGVSHIFNRCAVGVNHG